jgi:GAF domain-containing protein
MADRRSPARDRAGRAAATSGDRTVDLDAAAGASGRRTVDLDAPARAADHRADADPHERALRSVGLPELLTIELKDATLDGLLRRVADAAYTAMPVAAHASVTLVRAGVHTVASTSDMAGELDQTQYAAGGGPCVEAVRTGARQLIDDVTIDGRWPAFQRAAAERRILGALAVPLVVETQTVGALNLYSTSAGAWTPAVVDAAETFAGFASVAVRNADLYADQLAHVAQLQDAMRSRAIIEQAKGVLMAAHRVGPDEAFGMLSGESRRTGRTVRDIAAELVTSAGGIVPETDDAGP